MCGGFQGSGAAVSDKCYRIHPGWGGWNLAPAMSQKRAKAASYSNGDMFIVAGGDDGDGAMTDSVEMFNGATWSNLKALSASTEGWETRM